MKWHLHSAVTDLGGQACNGACVTTLSRICLSKFVYNIPVPPPRVIIPPFIFQTKTFKANRSLGRSGDVAGPYSTATTFTLGVAHAGALVFPSQHILLAQRRLPAAAASLVVALLLLFTCSRCCRTPSDLLCLSCTRTPFPPAGSCVFLAATARCCSPRVPPCSTTRWPRAPASGIMLDSVTTPTGETLKRPACTPALRLRSNPPTLLLPQLPNLACRLLALPTSGLYAVALALFMYLPTNSTRVLSLLSSPLSAPRSRLPPGAAQTERTTNRTQERPRHAIHAPRLWSHRIRI